MEVAKNAVTSNVNLVSLILILKQLYARHAQMDLFFKKENALTQFAKMDTSSMEKSVNFAHNHSVKFANPILLNPHNHFAQPVSINIFSILVVNVRLTQPNAVEMELFFMILNVYNALLIAKLVLHHHLHQQLPFSHM